MTYEVRTATAGDATVPTQRIAVAERDAEIIGFASSGPPLDESDRATGAGRQLYTLYVLAEHHGTGIGQQWQAPQLVPVHPRRMVRRQLILIVEGLARLHHHERIVAVALRRHMQAVHVQVCWGFKTMGSRRAPVPVPDIDRPSAHLWRIVRPRFGELGSGRM